MEKFPTLTTDNLLLSELRAADIPQIVAYANNPAVSRYTQNIPFPYQEKNAIYWLNMAHTGFRAGTHYVFAIRDPATQNFLGGIGLTHTPAHRRAELGYWLAEPYWGNGFVTEAAAAVLRFGFMELGLQRITASYLAANPASGRVMEKSGMLPEGVRRQHIQRDGKLYDLVEYGILRADYFRE